MDDETRTNISVAMIQIYESLNSACNQAGGSGFTIEELGDMSADRLLSTLSTNGVRFIYTDEVSEFKVVNKEVHAKKKLVQTIRAGRRCQRLVRDLRYTDTFYLCTGVAVGTARDKKGVSHFFCRACLDHHVLSQDGPPVYVLEYGA